MADKEVQLSGPQMFAFQMLKGMIGKEQAEALPGLFLEIQQLTKDLREAQKIILIQQDNIQTLLGKMDTKLTKLTKENA